MRPRPRQRPRPQRPHANGRLAAIALIINAVSVVVLLMMTASPTLAEIPSKGKHSRVDTQQTAQEEADMPRFAEPIANVTVSIGRDALLACVVENLKGYKVAWVRVDTQTILSIHHNVISQNNRISLTYNDHRSWYLHIKEVEETDRGWYMCQVNTDPMRSRKGYLQVVVPPMIVEGMTSNDMVVREGQNVSLMCKARGYPEPYVMWRREDGEEMLIGGEHVNVVDGELLHITKVSRLHMAAYLCVASNGVPPSISKRVHLRVQFPPMLSIPNQLEGAYVGQDVMLECHTEAYPASINYWTTERGDMIISDTSRAGDKYETTSTISGYTKYMKLKIRAVGPNDFGTYRCVAKNSLGETDGNIKLDEMPTPTTAIISEMAMLNRSYGNHHAGNTGDNNQTPVRNPPGAFHNSAGSLAQHNLLGKIMRGIKTQSFGIFKRLSSYLPAALLASLPQSPQSPSLPSRWRMSNMKNQAQPQYSPETVVNAQPTNITNKNNNSICQRTSKTTSTTSSRNKWAWHREQRQFHIAHTPRVASTQKQCHWPMLICIVILASIFVATDVMPKLLSSLLLLSLLLLLLHFIGSRIAFSISATHRQHLMLTFWAVGNKLAVFLPQIYTATATTTTLTAATAATTAAANANTFAVLCFQKYSR
ncbi:neural cell adhesion molecule L1 isoform X2 [Drosophila sulfurigaster albostrigata]|uniref:neural cell adhesion molecule L1 isoform X2 n=1 Tax=Drosophila sulfurigaster albostrigata TaxID=89887 RepID=UPI002D219C63|nr:neural cell adhesion molecule L1 isoform X2 [Drosophila sulfurigaster albostrigata]